MFESKAKRDAIQKCKERKIENIRLAEENQKLRDEIKKLEDLLQTK